LALIFVSEFHALSALFIVYSHSIVLYKPVSMKLLCLSRCLHLCIYSIFSSFEEF